MIFNTIADLREVISVSANADFNLIKPHIITAERDYLAPVLGDAMYAELDEFAQITYPENPSDVQQDMKSLLHIARRAVSHLAYYIGYEMLNAYIGDGGFKRTESEKIKSLFKYQEDNLKNYLRTTGYNALDSVLIFMEANPESFQEWKQSATYTVYKSAIFPSTQSFSVGGLIGDSRLIFLRLQAPLLRVEDLHISPALGASVYAEFKAGISAEPVPPKVAELLPYVRSAMRYLALAELMRDTGADITDKGLFFQSRLATSPDNTESKPANAERIAEVSGRYHATGINYLNLLTKHLRTKATDWPAFDTASSATFSRDNTNKKTFWA